jgi:hypothetical protein
LIVANPPVRFVDVAIRHFGRHIAEVLCSEGLHETEFAQDSRHQLELARSPVAVRAYPNRRRSTDNRDWSRHHGGLGTRLGFGRPSLAGVPFAEFAARRGCRPSAARRRRCSRCGHAAAAAKRRPRQAITQPGSPSMAEAPQLVVVNVRGVGYRLCAGPGCQRAWRRRRRCSPTAVLRSAPTQQHRAPQEAEARAADRPQSHDASAPERGEPGLGGPGRKVTGPACKRCCSSA